jgi:hypothetical protein
VLASNDHAIPVAPPELTIAVCTHSPLRDVLARALESLLISLASGLPLTLLVVDNALTPLLTDAESELDRIPHPTLVFPAREIGLARAHLSWLHEIWRNLLRHLEDHGLHNFNLLKWPKPPSFRATGTRWRWLNYCGRHFRRWLHSLSPSAMASLGRFSHKESQRVSDWGLRPPRFEVTERLSGWSLIPES